MHGLLHTSDWRDVASVKKTPISYHELMLLADAGNLRVISHEIAESRCGCAWCARNKITVGPMRGSMIDRSLLTIPTHPKGLRTGAYGYVMSIHTSKKIKESSYIHFFGSRYMYIPESFHHNIDRPLLFLSSIWIPRTSVWTPSLDTNDRPSTIAILLRDFLGA